MNTTKTTYGQPALFATETTTTPRAKTIPVHAVRLIRDGSATAPYGVKIRSPRDIAAIVAPIIADLDREHLVAVHLDAKSNVTGITTVAIGDASSAIVHPRETFKAAILASASSIIVCHNHPSGDPTPSPEDVAITRRLVEAGEILGIELLDHIVIGNGHHVSLKERGLM